MGYHKNIIQKGVVGETSKIQEELDELNDAISQNVIIMQLCEIADICAAIELYLEKYHPNISIEDCIKMGRLTVASFKEGSRK